MIHIETHYHHSPVYKTLVIAIAYSYNEDFPRGSVVKNLSANVRDMSSVPGWGRSPGEGNGNSVQYSCLENPMTEELGGLQSTGSQRVGHN